MLWRSSLRWRPTLGLALALLPTVALAQDDSPDGPGFNTDALSIIGYTLIGSFALASLTFAVLGVIVALQWPQPHVCCYAVPFSDSPRERGCCSLYRLNFSFAVLWVVFFIVSAISRRVTQLLVCLGFALIHVGVVSYLRHKFNSLGYHDAQPDLELPTGGVVTAMLQDSTSLGRFARGRPAAGIPVFNIPLSSAVVGRLSEADACGCSACQGRPLPGYAYLHPDAAGEAELREAMAAALRRAGMDGEVLVGEAAAAAAAAGPGGRGADTPAVAVPQLVPQGGSAAAGAAAASGPVSIAVNAGERASGHGASGADVEEARGGGIAGPAPAASAPRDGPGPGPQSGPGPAHATPFPLNLLLVEGIPVDSLPSEVGRSRSSRRLRPASSVSQSRLLRLLSSAALASPAVAPVPAGGQLPASMPNSQRPPLGSPPMPWQQPAQQEMQPHGTAEHEQHIPGHHYQQQQQEGARQQQQLVVQQQEGQRQVSRAPSLAPVDSVSPRGSFALSAQSPTGEGSGLVQATRQSRWAS